MLRSMEPRIPPRVSTWKSASAMKCATVIEVRAGVIEAVVIGENSAVGDIGAVIENNSMVMPVISPVVPPPAKSAKEPDAKAEAKRDSRSGQVQPWIPIPSRPNSERLAIDQPWIECRDVNDPCIGRLDHDRLPLLGDGLL